MNQSCISMYCRSVRFIQYMYVFKRKVIHLQKSLQTSCVVFFFVAPKRTLSNYSIDCFVFCEQGGENKCKTPVIDFASEDIVSPSERSVSFAHPHQNTKYYLKHKFPLSFSLSLAKSNICFPIASSEKPTSLCALHTEAG